MGTQKSFPHTSVLMCSKISCFLTVTPVREVFGPVYTKPAVHRGKSEHKRDLYRRKSVVFCAEIYVALSDGTGRVFRSTQAYTLRYR